MTEHAKTLGELKQQGYEPRSVRDEIRANLRRKLAAGEPVFPGIYGYERTVIPGVINALLAGHDFILLGLRGQAKTRILRALTALLDDEIPVLAGTDLNEDPFHPISTVGRKLLAERGDDAPIAWLPRASRYNEKLATPDVTIADLLGDIDPIKAATRKLTYADPEVIHYGIIPRTNRGIFAINELPDLAPRIQVGLLNILEERDLQIRGFPIRLPLDILLVFSANPEDYTNRGTIITPLKDRIASQILTHYPPNLELAAQITRQEAVPTTLNGTVELPDWAVQLIERITAEARNSDLVDQTSGVSARVSISALELLAANLERRHHLTGDTPVYPRLADFHTLLPAITGKLEMVYEGEQKGVEVVARQIIGQAAAQMFEEQFPEIDRALGSGGEDDTGPYSQIIAWFAAGNELDLSDEMPFEAYRKTLSRVPGLLDLATAFGENEQEQAFAGELILEGLHQAVKLAREDLDSHITYKEMVKFQLLSSRRRSNSDDEAN
jgi:magnesium chelatase subunit I